MRNLLEKVRKRDYEAVKQEAQAIYRAESRFPGLSDSLTEHLPGPGEAAGAQFAHIILRLVQPLRSVGTILQRVKSQRIVAPFPAVEGLPSDAEIAAGRGGIPIVSLVVIEPLQPLVSCPA
ncbi:MAG TPA: hypothetical protein VKV79_02935 [Terriglobia bacterium]|nr:hypothetical protein [Terriglobia bacterium]